MYFCLSLLQFGAQPSLGRCGSGRRFDLWELGWSLLSLSHHPSDVSFSLAAPVPEGQKGQGPGPVRSSAMAAGMQSVASFLRVVSGTSSGGTGRHSAVGCTLLISPPSAPLSICRPHWAPGECEHGQHSAALLGGQAGVAWAMLWAQCSPSVAACYSGGHSPGPALW